MKHNPFYDKRAWKDKRQFILQRDRFLCQRCLKSNKITPATTVHHIKELEDYPELSLEDGNLVSLCYACHEQIHLRAAGSSRPKKNKQPKGVRIIKA